MQEFNTPNVLYLEDTDFKEQGSSIVLSSSSLKRNSMPFFADTTIVMVQGNYCGYCTQFKPIFQQLADDLIFDSLDFATIRIDSPHPSEQIFKSNGFFERLTGRPLEGVPTLLKFVNGKFMDVFQGKRTYNDVRSWVMS